MTRTQAFAARMAAMAWASASAFALAMRFAGCAATPAGKVAVDLRRERSDNVIVRFHDALVYVDGERVADIVNGEHIVFWLTPGTHRIGVSTQFDPVVKVHFVVTPDTRYSNRASVSFNDDHRIVLRRVAN